MKSGIVHTAGFLPTMQCTELVAECARYYNPASRDIVAPDGRILAHISDEATREAFRIPEYHNVVYVTKDEADRMYQDHLEEYDAIVNHSWLDKPRKGASKLQRKSLVRAYFKEDIGDMIVLLNRIMENPQGAPSEPSMYYFINEIMNGVKLIDWARMISDNLDSQLKNLEANRTFFMSSYLFYSLATTYRYRGLTYRAEVGNKENQFPVYDWLSPAPHGRKVSF